MSERRFSLEKFRRGVSKRAAELRHSEDANVRSRDDLPSDEVRKPFTFQQEDYDRTEAPKDRMRKYWRQFETTPIVRSSITSFASQVMASGYYLEAEDLDEEELKELDHWLTRSSIIEGEPGKDFRLLAKKALIQREVRGTALIEKAPDRNNPDEIAGLKLINPETMEAVTRPGQSILLEPDDLDEFEDAPEAESGGAAAYLQDLSETQTFFGTPVRREDVSDKDEEFKVGFRRDEIIKLTRDADAGEIFGTSRIESVSNRIEGIKQKLDDNDEAIASKAYPLWLFLFGTEENPWDSDDINTFMKAHEMEQFHPGMKQGVRGDVDVKTISGEVAEIAEYLDFDIDWIMSAMPMPKWALGSFGDAPGQIDGMVQQQDINRQINEARLELEDEFSPLVREVAKQMGIDEDAAETIRLKIGDPNQPTTDVTPRENIIRYVPEDQRNASPEQPQQQQPQQRQPQQEQEESPEEPVVENIEEWPSVEETRGRNVWHTDRSIEQLTADADSVQEHLSDEIYSTFEEAREAVLDSAQKQYEDSPIQAVTRFESLANSTTRRAMRRGRFSDSVRPLIEERVSSVMSELEATHGSYRRSHDARFFTQDVEHSTDDALDEMMRLMRTQLRRGAANGDSWEAVEHRIRDDYSDTNLRERAELIAHMELRNAESTTKLQHWEDDDDVIGVRVVNDDPSTRLTQSLASAEAEFDDGDISSQWMENTRDEFLQKGFDPIPPTPPFHFNDTTTLEPVYGDGITEENNTEEQENNTEEKLELENIRREEEVRQKREAVLDKLLGDDE